MRASDLIKCGHCGRTITGERKTQKTKAGERDYVYYRCSKYSGKGHPRVRLTEADLDQQMLALFGKLRIEDDEVRDWVLRVLRARTREEQDCTREQRTELNRQFARLQGQRDELLNLRLYAEIDPDTFAAKDMELRRKCLPEGELLARSKFWQWNVQRPFIDAQSPFSRAIHPKDGQKLTVTTPPTVNLAIPSPTSNPPIA